MLGRVFLDRYETIRLLGEGGMGAVYLARDSEQDEPVVVKVMHQHIATEPKFRERFGQETVLMQSFQHPNAVGFLDACADDPKAPCIVMEYVPGITLDKLLARNRRFSPARVRRLLAQFCDVLQAAHDAGIIHRDLKPANLMVADPDTPHEILKVMDFGLAEMVESESNHRDRPAEYAVGTPGYMPPEQVRGEAMDHRGDLYSVGVILYQLLSGRLPFQGETTMEILMAQAEANPPSFESLGLGEQVPPAVEAVIRSCLAAEAEDRPACAGQLGQDYEAALSKAFTKRPATVPAPQEGRPGLDTKSDPNAFVEQMEAWMPEQIARYKLEGFVQEAGGKITGNAAGMVRVRLVRSPVKSVFSELAYLLGKRPHDGPIDMELLLKKKVGQDNLLLITVKLRPTVGGRLPLHPEWTVRCEKIIRMLKAYLMSKS